MNRLRSGPVVVVKPGHYLPHGEILLSFLCYLSVGRSLRSGHCPALRKATVTVSRQLSRQ